MERFSKSTGDIDFSSSSIFQPRRGLVRSRTLSAGAGDGGSWKQTDRRRMPKGKHLNGISTSLRSLPRETELQLEEDASNEITPDKIEDEFQAIFDKIHQIDTKVKAVINMFPDEHRSCPPLLDAVAESSLRSERSEL